MDAIHKKIAAALHAAMTNMKAVIETAGANVDPKIDVRALTSISDQLKDYDDVVKKAPPVNTAAVVEAPPVNTDVVEAPHVNTAAVVEAPPAIQTVSGQAAVAPPANTTVSGQAAVAPPANTTGSGQAYKSAKEKYIQAASVTDLKKKLSAPELRGLLITALKLYPDKKFNDEYIQQLLKPRMYVDVMKKKFDEWFKNESLDIPTFPPSGGRRTRRARKGSRRR